MVDTSERDFEDRIVEALTTRGEEERSRGGVREDVSAYHVAQSFDGAYRQRSSGEHYDRRRCLDPDLVIDFVRATQPKEWDRLIRAHGESEVRERFLTRVVQEIEQRGALRVLREGVRDSGTHVRMAYFRPSSGLNEEALRLYRANTPSVVRQLVYDDAGHSLDLVIFLNGLPLFTAELKDELAGQNYVNAIGQYKTDRDPRQPLFRSGRCLAHFALDTSVVRMTTKLEGDATHFLPFDRGRNGGAGNPPSATKFATSYLWEEVWAPDSLLNLVDRFIHMVEHEDDSGRKTGERTLIFPRYHQLDTVRRLVLAAREEGAGHRYLVQHSAGSGKSNTIAWLAHQLSVLHDEQDERVFDSIIVLTDRRILDRQLRNTVRQFEQTLGVVEAIEGSSQDLRAALEAGRTIITSTIQKFPVIAGEIEQLPGQRFAVIIDEAHSTQSGETAVAVHEVLGESDEAALTAATEAEAVEDEPEDPVERQARLRQQPSNMSSFAFTATPKRRTLELFGTHQPDGSFRPFALYSMRQAIEEGFILDVLEHYMTYRTFYNVRKTIDEDPKLPHAAAARLIRQYVQEHPHTIDSKISIMLSHYDENVAQKIGKRAKAMVVTSSRLHTVRYRQAIDRFLEEHDLPYKALVAFSGTVRDHGHDYTESGMNGFPESQTARRFGTDEYQLLVVAMKFQTGFDQPLLHTMYVDRNLGGVNAVQTLSRLNRIHPPLKQDTAVLDFANEAEDIKAAFTPYYDRTELAEATDPNQLYSHMYDLQDAGVYEPADATAFADLFFAEGTQQEQLRPLLTRPITRYLELEADQQHEFRSRLNSFIRLYAFVAQIAALADRDLEALYIFGRYLWRSLPVQREELPVEVRREIDLDQQRIDLTFEGAIELERGRGRLQPQAGDDPSLTEDEPDALSEIIREINDRFGTEWSETDRVIIEQLNRDIAADDGLRTSVTVNDEANARLTFDQVAGEKFAKLIDSNFSLYKTVNDDDSLRRRFFDLLFDVFMRDVA